MVLTAQVTNDQSWCETGRPTRKLWRDHIPGRELHFKLRLDQPCCWRRSWVQLVATDVGKQEREPLHRKASGRYPAACPGGRSTTLFLLNLVT